jgi:mannosyltransferase OCH1-like enzyme
MKIPKVMHQIWWQGESALPEKFKEYRDTYIELHPDWQIELWDEPRVNALIEEYPEFHGILDRYERMIQKIDVARLIIIYTQGGIYLDMDTKALKNIEEIINPDTELLLYEFHEKKPFGIHPLCAIHTYFKYRNGPYLQNDIFGAVPEHPFFKDLIDSLPEYSQKGKWMPFELHVLISTGPLFLTIIAREHGWLKKDGVQLLNRMMVDPCNRAQLVYKLTGVIKPPCHGLKDAYIYNDRSNTWTENHNKLKIITWTVFIIIVLSGVGTGVYIASKNKKKAINNKTTN